MKARSDLRDGFDFRLGDGSSSFWFTPWTNFGKLCDTVLYVDIHDLHLKVTDVFQGGRWQLERLYTSMPSHVVESIESRLLHLNADIPDSFTWKGNMDGLYNAKTGYQWLTRHANLAAMPDIDGSWKWIWRVAAPEKLKFLIWTACHHSLPTRTMLHNRGMLQSASCPRCPMEPESILHCLRDCAFAKQLWLSLGFDNINFFLDQSISAWLRRGSESEGQCVFLSACWWIWRARNLLCMEDKHLTIYQLKTEVYKLASLIHKIFTAVGPANDNGQWTAWHPVDNTATVLNVDGSSLGNPGISGFGGVLRRHDGSWIFGFGGNIGLSSILQAELLAIYHGLRVAWDQGHRHLVCYSDSTLALQLISTEVNSWHLFAPIINNIKELMARDWNLQLIHTWREANATADFLAKMGANSNEAWHEFLVPPDGVLPCLQDDALRVQFARR
jgi:ribonuclease HI